MALAMPPESASKFFQPFILFPIHNFFSLYSGPFLIRETAATPSSEAGVVPLVRFSQVATAAAATTTRSFSPRKARLSPFLSREQN